MDILKDGTVVAGTYFYNEMIWLVIIWPIVIALNTIIPLNTWGFFHPHYIIAWNFLHDIIGYGLTSYRNNFHSQLTHRNYISTILLILYTLLGILVAWRWSGNPHLNINYGLVTTILFVLRIFYIIILYKKYQLKKLLYKI